VFYLLSKIISFDFYLTFIIIASLKGQTRPLPIKQSFTLKTKQKV